MNDLDLKVIINRKRFQPVISLLSFVAVIFNITTLIVSANIVFNIYMVEGSQWTKDVIIRRIQNSGDIFFEEKAELIINMVILFAVTAFVFIGLLSVIVNRLRMGDLGEEVKINRFLGYTNMRNFRIVLKELMFDYIISIPFVIISFILIWGNITTNSPLKYIFEYTDSGKGIKFHIIAAIYLVMLAVVVVQTFVWIWFEKKQKK